MLILDKITLIANNIPQVLLTSFGLVLLLLIAELIFVDYKKSSLYNLIKFDRSSSIDFFSAIFVLSNASLFLGTFLSFGVFFGLGKLIRYYFDLNILDYNKNPYLCFFIYIFILDFVNYWAHRFMHEIPLLWAIHSFHHSATKMTMLTALRDHPLERAILHFFKAIPAALLGMPIVDYFLIALILQIIGYIKHGNMVTNFGLIGDYIIQSPLAHKIHHSISPHEHGLNYASLFQFWDIVFGTAKNSSDDLDFEIGLKDIHEPNSFFGEIITVTVNFYKELFSLKK
jgi:sterol desaturase/sphingolipid hydroxylase (fatty acid hydroxylase superfamily)